ncbi:hypothetical protein MMC20_005904 [Loxospora ochrophaea]|nr:hypothetical protein [Loxospora ochrophaea]
MARATSLHIAAFCGDVDMVILLLSYGFNIDGSEECECTPLTIAVTMDHSSVVRVLLEHGAPPDSKDKGGKTPLYTAARAGQLPIINALLEYGAGPNVKRRNGETPPCEAARYCQLAAINTLLEHGASLHVQTESGMTPLHYAAAGMSRSDVLWLLLDKGAKVNALDRTRSTAAHCLFCDLGPSASREPLGQKQRSLQLLISKGASILVLNSEGWTAMRVTLLVIRARLAIQVWAACPEWRVFTQGVCRRFLTALWDTLSVLSDYLVFSNSIENNSLRQGRPTGNQELIDPWVSRDIRETWVTRQQLTRWSLKFLLDGAMLLGDESFVGFSEGSLGGECIRQSSEGSLDGEVQRFVQESLGALLKSKKSFGQDWGLGWDLYIKDYLDVSHEGVESYKD